MKMFFKNVLRTILKNKFSYIGVILILSMGIMVYVTMAEYLDGMQAAADLYYERTNFADVFAVVEQMPETDVADLQAIEGVKEASGRLEGDVRWLTEDSSDSIVSIHLMGWEENAAVNRIYLWPEDSSPSGNEIYLSRAMAEAHGLEYGDTITVIAGGRLQDLVYSGDAAAPECMSIVPDSSVEAPDYTTYDMAAMEKGALEKLLGREHVVNHIGLTLQPGVTFSDVKYNIEAKLREYGLYDLSARKNNAGFYAVQSEIDSMRNIQKIIPTIFMAVSIFLLYVMLKKMIDKDRTLIGMMKAFGATNREIISVYIMQGFIIGLLGGILPIPAAEAAGNYLLVDDALYYNLPLLEDFTFSVGRIASGIGISVFSGVLSILIAMLDVLRINPADSMKSAVPGGFNIAIPPRLAAILNTRQKISLRSIFRTPLRNLIIAIAIAFPFSMIVVCSCFSEGIVDTLEGQYTLVETGDLKVTLAEFADKSRAEGAIRSLSGVTGGEAMAEYDIRITAGGRSGYSSLKVVEPNSECRKIMDNRGKFYEPPEDGILMNAHAARKLGIQAGDVIEINSFRLTGEKGKAGVPVLGLVEESSGGCCYISPDGLRRYFAVPEASNVLSLIVEDGAKAEVRQQLAGMKNVLFVSDNEQMAALMVEALSTLVVLMQGLAFFSVVAGAVMIYHIVNISIIERQNEFGTLMVLGMSSREIDEVVTFEQTINLVVGILLALPMIKFLSGAVVSAVETSGISFNINITPQYYLLAFAVILPVFAITIRSILRLIRRIVLTEVLKGRD